MKKQFSLVRAVRLCATICILGCAGFLGCNKSEDPYMPDDFDDLTENAGADKDKDYDAWVEKFDAQLKNGGAVVAGQAGFAVGATGSAPSFNFAAATTGDAPATFNFGAAATTGDAPVAFNFNPAPKKETLPSFNAGAAVATVDGADPLTQVIRKKAALKAAAAEARKAVEQANAKATKASKDLEAAKEAYVDATQKRDAAANAVEDAKNAVAVAQDAETKANAAVNQATENQKTAVANVQKADAVVKSAGEERANRIAERDAVAEELKKFDAATADVSAKKDAASNALNVAKNAVNLAKEEATKSQNALKEASDKVQAASAESQSLNAAFQTAVAKATEAKDAAQRAREALESLAEDAEESARVAAQEAVKTSEDASAAAQEAATVAEQSLKNADQATAAALQNEQKAKDAANAALKVVEEKTAAMNTAESNLTALNAQLTKRAQDRQAEVAKATAASDAAQKAVDAEATAQDVLAKARQALDESNANLAKSQDQVKTAVSQREESEGNLKKSQDALTQSNAQVKVAEEKVTAETNKSNQAKKELQDAEAARQKIQKEADSYATKVADATPKHFFFAELALPYAANADDDVRVPSSENLEEALNSLIEALERDVDDLAMIPDFEDGIVSVQRDANALAVVALTIGASDADSPSKPFAASLIKAAQELANSKDAAEVKTRLENVKKARQVKSDEKLTWDLKVASLRPIMKSALPALSTDIKRLARNEKTFLRRDNARKTINASTIMVAVALGCRENVDETLAPDSEDLWREYCAKLADAALDYNEKANALVSGSGSFDDLKEAGKRLEETCSSTCHEKFGGRAAE